MKMSKFKRITMPVFVGIISFYISVLFCFGVIAGYVFAKYFSERIKSIKFTFYGYRIHLHHWFCFVLGFVVVLVSGIYYLLPAFVLGFGSGITFQGIYCYSDWYKILSKK